MQVGGKGDSPGTLGSESTLQHLVFESLFIARGIETSEEIYGKGDETSPVARDCHAEYDGY